MVVAANENLIARQWRGQLPLIILFQFAGLFFVLFYYPELLMRTHDWIAPSYSSRETVSALLAWAFERTNSLQLILSDQYHFLILGSLASVGATLALILCTSLRRIDFGVVLRACAFLLVGLLAIPTVLLAYVLRWIPGAIYSFFSGIFSAIASLFAFLAPYVGGVVIALVSIFAVLGFVILLARSFLGRVVLAAAVVLVGSLFFLPSLLDAVTGAAFGAWEVASDFAAYPVAGLGYIFGFIGAVFAFIFSTLLVLIPLMFITSQFGHIFLDSLFDARNVRRSARAAGRFLVGIGFLASTIVLCLPGNELAQRGLAEAVVSGSQMLGGYATYEDGIGIAAHIGTWYLMFIPNEVETSIVAAFSQGYPPSLELILITIASGIAFYLIAVQMFSAGREESIGIAFFPIELVFLLIGAVLIVLIALASANDNG